jgi:hypothetical protein
LPCFIEVLTNGQQFSYFGMNASRYPTHHKMKKTSNYEKRTIMCWCKVKIVVREHHPFSSCTH